MPLPAAPESRDDGAMRDGEQSSGTVMLVRPARFGFHPAAAQSNAFAADSADADVATIARDEFDGLKDKLERSGVRCMVLEDQPEASCPDAVFPNNWVSFHDDGTVIYYPMANEARRAERRPEALEALLKDAGFAVGRSIDLSALEARGIYLEGTGSLILDRPARRAFACRSARTTEAGLDAWEAATGWRVERFDAADRHGRPIYHTNVMLSLGTRFAIVCAEAIVPEDRDRVIRAIADGRRTLIDVTFDQMERFAGNLIELRGGDGSPLIALSQTAHDCLTAQQRRQLEALGGPFVAAAIPTIERVGGGSVRCMIADVHLPPR